MLKVAGRGITDRDTFASTKNEDLWGKIGKRASNSRSGYSLYACAEVAIGPSQRSRFSVLTKRSAASGDENGPRAGRLITAGQEAHEF